ncbi:OmpH family outer membrane protein, partial [Crocinitomicaceae bacterium]|nr:OmpH family outer membrane protein [Crocinitomicaceae bacterium]
MMKYIFMFVLIFGTTFANSQSYAYIDSDYIMSKVPEYVDAKDKLDKLAERWTKEIEDRYEAVKKKKNNFEREEILLPKEEKEKRQQEIENLEQEALELQT